MEHKYKWSAYAIKVQMKIEHKRKLSVDRNGAQLQVERICKWSAENMEDKYKSSTDKKEHKCKWSIDESEARL